MQNIRKLSLDALVFVSAFIVFMLAFSSELNAFQFQSLPSGNLIKNAWFQENCKFSLANWQTTPDAPWGLSDKVQDPTDVNCKGTWWGFAARFARNSGATPEFYPNKNARLWQVVGPVNPNDRTLQFHALIVAHRVNEYSAKIYGSNNPSSNQWTLVWTPLNIQNCLSQDCVNNKTGACNSGDRQCLWEELAEIYFGSINPISTTISQGYTHYKVEFLMNYPTPVTPPPTGDVGGKVARVYFNVKPASGGGTTAPTATPTPTVTPSITANPTSGATVAPSGSEIAAVCTEMRAIRNGQQITQIQPGQEFDYRLTLSPANHTGLSVVDTLPEGLDIVASSLPNYCEVSGSVMGASVVQTSLSRTSIMVIMLVMIWVGMTGYLWYRYSKLKENEEITFGKRKLTKKQFRQVLVIALVTTLLLSLIAVGWIVRERRAAPDDSSAAEPITIACDEVPAGVTQLNFRVRALSSTVSKPITNTALVISAGSASTCSYNMTIIPAGVTPSQTPILSATPSVMPSATMGPTNTPLPTTLPSVAPSATVIPTVPPSQTPKPTVAASATPQPSATVQPTTGSGVVCGPADTNGDGKFTIGDFIDFAKMYQKDCSDKAENYGACGHKDRNLSGKVEITDFISFARRYAPRESCAL